MNTTFKISCICAMKPACETTAASFSLRCNVGCAPQIISVAKS